MPIRVLVVDDSAFMRRVVSEAIVAQPDMELAGVAINGLRATSTNLLLDGVPNNNEFAGDVGIRVPLDSVGEFSILTSDFTAEFGRAAGGVINVATNVRRLTAGLSLFRRRL